MNWRSSGPLILGTVTCEVHMRIWKSLLGLFLIFFGALPAPADNEVACVWEELADETDTTDGQRLFELAQQLKKAEIPAEITDRRKIRISGLDEPTYDRVMDRLLQRFTDYYRPGAQALDPRTISSPNAPGNQLHMGDHRAMADEFGEDYRQRLGIDPRSFAVITMAHDLGKAVLNKLMQQYIAEKVDAAAPEGSLNAAPGTLFLKKFVMSHDEHTFVEGLPKIVAEVAKEMGLTKDQAVELYTQILGDIRNHNFGPKHVDPATDKATALAQLKERYPELSTEEIGMLYDAFWVKFYGNGVNTPVGRITSYAEDLKIDRVHGQPQGPKANALALDDRIGLVTDGAMNKIPNQNYSRFGFGRGLIRGTFLEGDAIGKTTGALVRAQLKELNPYRQPGTPPLDEFNFRPARYGIDVANMATRFGEKLDKMNSDENLKQHGLSPSDADNLVLYRTNSGEVFKLSSGAWSAPPGTPGRKFVPGPVTIEIYSGGKFRPATKDELPPASVAAQREALEAGHTDPRTAWDILMDFARRDYQGPIIPTPAQWATLPE